jgi:hypothetical protein
VLSRLHNNLRSNKQAEDMMDTTEAGTGVGAQTESVAMAAEEEVPVTTHTKVQTNKTQQQWRQHATERYQPRS